MTPPARRPVRRPVRRRFALALLFVVGIPAALGAEGALTVEAVAVAVAGGMLWAYWRTSTAHQRKVERSLSRIDAALFGPETADGSRPTGGLVRTVDRLSESCAAIPGLSARVEQTAVLAQTAAAAVRAMQNRQREERGLPRLPEIELLDPRAPLRDRED